MLKWIALALVTLLTATANVLLRSGMLAVKSRAAEGTYLDTLIREPRLYGAVICLAFALLSYTFVLRSFEVSVAYPIMTSASLVVVCVLSVVILRESFDMMKLAGTGMIVGGVVLLLLSRGSAT